MFDIVDLHIHHLTFFRAYQFALGSFGVKSFGLVRASVAGLSHLFHTVADRNGAQLKRLAAFLGKSCEKAYGMSKVVLRRNTNVPADANAVSVLVPNPDQLSEGGEALKLPLLDLISLHTTSPLSLFPHGFDHCSTDNMCSEYFSTI